MPVSEQHQQVDAVPAEHPIETARQALAMGCYLSFAGNATYPKLRDLLAVAAAVPADRLLLQAFGTSEPADASDPADPTNRRVVVTWRLL